MIFRQKASRLILNLTVCIGVAGGCAFLGCSSSEYGAAPSAKETITGTLDGPPAKPGAKGGGKTYTKSVKSKLFKKDDPAG
jgi:hypothetical protein